MDNDEIAALQRRLAEAESRSDGQHLLTNAVAECPQRVANCSAGTGGANVRFGAISEYPL